MKSESHSVVSDSLRPHGLYSPWNSLGQNTRAFPFSRGTSQPRDQIQVSPTVGRFFTPEPQGKFKNTGVGSLSLLQGIFMTPESNGGLLHCRQILYQLSDQRSLVNSHLCFFKTIIPFLCILSRFFSFSCLQFGYDMHRCVCVCVYIYICIYTYVCILIYLSCLMFSELS